MYHAVCKTVGSARQGSIPCAPTSRRVIPHGCGDRFEPGSVARAAGVQFLRSPLLLQACQLNSGIEGLPYCSAHVALAEGRCTRLQSVQRRFESGTRLTESEPGRAGVRLESGTTFTALDFEYPALRFGR